MFSASDIMDFKWPQYDIVLAWYLQQPFVLIHSHSTRDGWRETERERERLRDRQRERDRQTESESATLFCYPSCWCIVRARLVTHHVTFTTVLRGIHAEQFTHSFGAQVCCIYITIYIHIYCIKKENSPISSHGMSTFPEQIVRFK